MENFVFLCSVNTLFIYGNILTRKTFLHPSAVYSLETNQIRINEDTSVTSIQNPAKHLKWVFFGYS